MTQSPTLGAVVGGGASGAQVRADLNLADQALATESEGTSAPATTYPFMLWRNNTAKLVKRRNAANTGWEIIENYGATTDPTTGDDSADGYVHAAIWKNVSANKVFVCTNPATGAAVWVQPAGAAGGAVSSVFGRGGAVVATSGDYTADKITDGGGKVIMTSAERTTLASFTSYWKTRLASDPVGTSLALLDAHQPRSLCVCYAAPIIINAVYDPDYAAGMLARYDDVVLGNGLQVPTDPNYSTTSSIIDKLAVLAPNTKIWGYIDIGVNSPAFNHSLATLQTQIDQWMTVGATGIFCDDYGYDFGVTRARQNSVIDYIHGKGVGAIMNAWNIDDALSSAVVATYNTGGVATHADSRDVYLLESWVFNSVAWTAPHFATFYDMKTRADAARTYRASLGVKMYALNIHKYTGTSRDTLDYYRGMAEALAHIWRLDGSGVAMANYAASGDDIGLVKPYPPLIGPMPGSRSLAAYTLNGGWTEVQAADLGITVHFEAGNYTWVAESVPAEPYDLTTFYPGVPGSSQLLLRFVAPRRVTFPASLTGSRASAGAAASAQTDIDIQVGGVSKGYARFAAGQTTATFSFTNAVVLVAGDVLTLVAPASADATLADITITLSGTR